MRLQYLYLLLFINLSVSNAQIYDCEVISYDTHITYSGRTVSTHTSYVLQINNAKGTNYAEFSIPYQEDNPLKNLNAHIEDTFGNVIKRLKSKDIEHTSAYSNVSFHSDRKIASFKLIHTQYPYVIKYSYTQEEDAFIALDHWKPALDQRIPVIKATLKVEVPVDTKLRIHEQHIEPGHIEHSGEQTTYRWSTDTIIRPQRENYAPSIDQIVPTVTVIPLEFQYGLKGNTESWTTYGNWVNLMNQGLDILTDEDRNKVHELTGHLSNDYEKIKTLYHYLQDNTRYINVSMDFGGLCPYPATYVGKNKYGDCKALTNYMKALLKEAGIYSIYTDVYAGKYPNPINPSLPSQQFNHVILCVPQPNDTIWLECTSSTLPFNYLGTFTQNRTVLLVEKDNSRLVQTPKLRANEVIEAYHHQISVTENGNATFSTTGTVKGAQYEFLKDLDTHVTASQKTDILDRFRLIKRTDIEDYELSVPDRDSTYVRISLSGTIQQVLDNLGPKSLLKPVNSFYMKLEKPAERTQPVFIPYPIVKIDTFNYSLPDNISKIAGLKNSTINGSFGNYQRSYAFEDNQLQVIRQLTINAGQYELDEYDAFYQFISQISKHEQQKTLITFN